MSGSGWRMITLPVLDRRAFLYGSAASTALLHLPVAASAVGLPSLDQLARAKGLRFGTATSPEQLHQPDLADLTAQHCSVLVAENAFKWKQMEPVQGSIRYENADAIATYASQHDMELRGHCLIWNQDNRIPAWMHKQEDLLAEGSGEKLIEAIWQHAGALAERYPQIASWDAVNEVITPGKGEIRDSLYTRILGEQLMDVGFAIMRARMPNVQLVYNDYMDWRSTPEHRDGVLRLLERALARNVPIDALGIQSHLINTLNRPIDEKAWRSFLEEVEGMGLKILVTELDCGDRHIEQTDPAQRDAEVAAFVKGYLDLTLSFSSVERVVLWAMSDRDSYLNQPHFPEDRRRADGLPMRAHPFDEYLEPKPMYAAIAAALRAAPERAPHCRA